MPDLEQGLARVQPTEGRSACRSGRLLLHAARLVLLMLVAGMIASTGSPLVPTSDEALNKAPTHRRLHDNTGEVNQALSAAAAVLNGMDNLTDSPAQDPGTPRGIPRPCLPTIIIVSCVGGAIFAPFAAGSLVIVAFFVFIIVVPLLVVSTFMHSDTSAISGGSAAWTPAAAIFQAFASAMQSASAAGSVFDLALGFICEQVCGSCGGASRGA